MCNLQILIHVIGVSSLIFQSVDSFSFTNKTRVRRQEEDCQEELPFALPNFKCRTGGCVPGEQECDGHVDCKDGSDETDECKNIKCSSIMFTCTYGACVKKEKECDGVFDCRDGSDENSPNCKEETRKLVCGSDQFRCSSGKCIYKNFKCDGKGDCDDHSDEIRATCFDIECPGFAYKCNYGACAPRDAECNGKLECFDGSDEDPNICNKTPAPPPSEAPAVQGGCVLPQHPKSGQWSIHRGEGESVPGKVVATGTVLQVSCHDSYKLEGHNALFCEEGGRWSADIGFCSKLCAPRVSTSTLQVTCIYKSRETQNCTEAVDGTLAKFTCAPFYEDLSLKRRPVHICKDGQWDGQKPDCVPVCGQKTVEATTLIINGTNAVKGDYPWQVAIYTLQESKDPICGGSLLNQRMVLTAAHCVTTLKGQLQPKENYRVAVGKYYGKFDDKRDEEAAFSELQEIFVPRQYKGYNQNYLADIAILITKIKFTLSRRVQPVCLDSGQNYDVPPNTNGYVTGWGFTVENSKPSPELKELKVPSVSVATCHSYLPEDYEIYLTHDKMCAGYVEKGTSVCRGDSGGALVFKHEDRYYVTGVVSLAPTSPTAVDGCDSQQYGLYTKVMEYINDFILPKLAEYA